MIIPDGEGVDQERYQITPKVYNKGHLISSSRIDNECSVIVNDILTHVSFFGFMGLIENQDGEMQADLQLRKKLNQVSELTKRLNLEIMDIDFPESFHSLKKSDHDLN